MITVTPHHMSRSSNPRQCQKARGKAIVTSAVVRKNDLISAGLGFPWLCLSRHYVLVHLVHLCCKGGLHCRLPSCFSKVGIAGTASAAVTTYPNLACAR